MGGILQSMGNGELDAKFEAEAQQKRDNANYQPQPVTVQMAHFVRQAWNEAKTAKLPMTDRLTDCLRRRRGIYSVQKMVDIESTGGSAIYMKITGAKCRAAKAWLSDLFNPSGDRPYSLDPTPIVEMPPEIEKSLISQAIQGALQMGVPQEQVEMLLEKHSDRLKDELNKQAEERCERMAGHIEDIMTQSNWRKEFIAFLDDLVTYPAAILKGPIYRKKKVLTWVEDETGKHVPKKVDKIVREFKRVSPFNFYPMPNTQNVEDGGVIEHIQFYPNDLTSMRGATGYDKAAIDAALTEYRVGGLREWLFNDGERERLEGKTRSALNSTDTIDGIEYTGTLQGRRLLEWGLKPDTIQDPLEEYSVSIVLIGNHVIRAMVNPDPSGKPYYDVSCWNPIPSSLWGEALPEILADTQDACNGAARSLMNNLAVSSGPQVAVDISTMKGRKVGKIAPWKVWKYDGSKISGSRAGISFFKADSNANELLSVYERFAKYADEISGLPAFAYGSDSGSGAAKTASGLSMLMNAATKPIKEVVRQVDINVIEPKIQSLFISLMLDPTVPDDAKGDAQIKARGSDTLIHKEAAAMRQLEMMQMTNNPTDMAIIGMEGRREQLREAYKSAELPVDRIVPTQEEMEQTLEQQAMAEQGQPNEQ